MSIDHPIIKPGDKFGKLTVQSIHQHYRGGKKSGFKVNCICDCGNSKVTTINHLTSGHITSCGCSKKQCALNNLKYANAYLQSHPEILQENGRSNVKYAHAYLQSHPEIRQENIAKVNEYLESHPEIMVENGRNSIKHAHVYLSSHPEILQENGRQNIKRANAYLQSHPEILQENGRSNVKYAHAYLASHPEIRQENLRNSESSLQKEYRLFLEQNNFPYETEFLLDNHYFDFKVNNFLIEINGDIYHSSKYENLSNPSSNGPSVRYKPQDHHKSLLDLAIKHGFRLIQLWEHRSTVFNKRLLLTQLLGDANIDDYVEYISNHKVICNDYGFNIQGTYLPDPGRWISTGYNEIVTESYPKGKVLVYNSGYTVLE